MILDVHTLFIETTPEGWTICMVLKFSTNQIIFNFSW